MKSLGFLVLLAFANTAGAEIQNTDKQETTLTLAMHQLVEPKAQVQVRTQVIQFDAQAVLEKANAKLEQELEQKLDQLLANKVSIVDLQ